MENCRKLSFSYHQITFLFVLLPEFPVKQCLDLLIFHSDFSGPDGKLTCTRCKRVFNKERVFNAHRCLAVSDYIDLSNTKDLVKQNSDNLGRLL